MTTLLILIVAAIVLLAVLLPRLRKGATRPPLPFPPSGESPSYDDLDASYALTDEHRRSLTQENVELFNQQQIDQIYARLEAGPIPDGPYRGSFFFADGGSVRKLSDLIGGLPGKLLDGKLDKLTWIGERIWKGKRFFRDQRVLRNFIDREELIAGIFHVPEEQLIRDEVFGREVALLFPAKLYEGESLLDQRRPSVIIDYADNADIDGFIEEIDGLVGKDGLQIRDEIRMIRPGLYLGRAYFGTLFGLNFSLYNEEVARSG